MINKNIEQNIVNTKKGFKTILACSVYMMFTIDAQAAPIVISAPAIDEDDVVVFTQAPETTAAQFQASIADPQFGFQSVADDFSLADDTTVTQISFWTNEVVNVLQNNAITLNVYSATAQSYADSLFSVSGMAGDNLTFSKTLVDDNIGLYKHSLMLPSLELSAGDYFLGIGADLINNNTPLAWTNAANNNAFEYIIGGGAVFPIGINQLPNIANGDLAFEIIGSVATPPPTPVNAPSFIGILALLGLLYNRKITS